MPDHADQRSNMIALTCRNLLCLFPQKINFIPHFFLKILERFYKIVILGVLGTTGHVHQNW